MTQPERTESTSQPDWFALAREAFHPHGGLLVAVAAADGDRLAQEAIVHTLRHRDAASGRNDDPKHIALVTAIAEKRGCIGPFPCGRDIPEFNGRDAECDCETAATEREGFRPATEREGFRPAMGDGGPCMSCGGNDGYGTAPHHEPGCYFASWEDEAHVA